MFFKENLHKDLIENVRIELRDCNGSLLEIRESHNIGTLDGGIFLARRARGDIQEPLNMLAIGTGALGAILSPDAPQNTQRTLNTEIDRKVFSALPEYKTIAGGVAGVPTNIMDCTVIFVNGEAEGPLNEMAIISAANTAVPNPIIYDPNLPYDPTIDVSGYDLLFNYFTFPVVTKQPNQTLTITWRITL